MRDATMTIERTAASGTGDGRTGMYVWHDLFTTDTKAAEAFYGALFGWTVTAMPMPDGMEGAYDILENDGVGFGGCMPLVEEMGGKPYWVPYISLPGATGGGREAVQAAVERAAARGATIGLPATEIPTVGHFATIVDVDGVATNAFDPIPPAGGVPAQPDVPPVGGITWHEIWVNDLDKAKALYASVYGWDIRDSGMPGMQYLICHDGERMQGGLGSTEGRMPAATVFYVLVADLEAAATRVAELGGSTEGPVMDVPDVGRMQWARDPQGASFALHQAPKG